MTFDFTGYELKFVQKETCKDGSAHLFTYIYKFYSPVTGYHYILRAEYHVEDVFAVKFYCKKDSRSEHKYSKIINKGDVGNILVSCAKIIPVLLSIHPFSSFGFIGSRTLDNASGKLEDHNRNQRFRIYREVVRRKFGTVNFEHVQFAEISGYLLVNRKSGITVEEKTLAIRRMLIETYEDLPDI